MRMPPSGKAAVAPRLFRNILRRQRYGPAGALAGGCSFSWAWAFALWGDAHELWLGTTGCEYHSGWWTLLFTVNREQGGKLLYSRPSLATQPRILGCHSDSVQVPCNPGAEIGAVFIGTFERFWCFYGIIIQKWLVGIALLADEAEPKLRIALHQEIEQLRRCLR